MISGVNGPDDRGRLQGDSVPESKTLWQKISKAVDNIFSVEDIQGPAPAITVQQGKKMVNPIQNDSVNYKPSKTEQIIAKFRNTIFGSSETKPTTPSANAEEVRKAAMPSIRVAEELLFALNGEDKELIDALMDKVNDGNAFNIYVKYWQHAEAVGEKAGSLVNMRGGLRTETLLQGIANNKVLSDKEKENYIIMVLDNLYSNASNNREKYGITDAKLEKFSNDIKSAIDSCVGYPYNADVLERRVTELYKTYLDKFN